MDVPLFGPRKLKLALVAAQKDSNNQLAWTSGTIGTLGTECRAVLTSSPETWLCTRPDPKARPTPSCLALKLGSHGSPPHNRTWILHSCCHRQLVDSTGLLTTTIPDLGLATMDVDVGVPLQLLADNLVHRCHTVGSTHHFDVVQESENFLCAQQPVRQRSTSNSCADPS